MVEKSETNSFLHVFDRLFTLVYKRETPHVIHGWKAYDVNYTCDGESLTVKLMKQLLFNIMYPSTKCCCDGSCEMLADWPII